ncbi:MAG: STT3 domain-containing protein [Candidatus Bathyarchaeia archaeon]
MKLRKMITREKIVNGLHRVSDVRVSVSRSTLLTISAFTLIFFIALSIRLLPIRWGLELSEFDPYLQFQFAEKIVNDGYFDWVTWTTREAKRWYPLEINVGKTHFPGLPMTAAALYDVLAVLGVPISLYHFCVIFPAIFGALACVVAYFLGKDIGGKAVGLFSALFLALNPSHITRTSAGFFDDETVGIGAILLFAFLFLRALDKERPQKHSAIYAVAAGLTIGYICASWGAALYPIGMAALFAFALILVKRYSRRLLISYSITFGLGLFLAINVPKLSTQFLTSSAVLPVLGVFGLLCLSEVLNSVKTQKWKIVYTAVFFTIVTVGFLALAYSGYLGEIGAKFLFVLNPLQREQSQIFQSVQEHRLTAWGSLYYDYGVGVLFFIVGLFFAIRELTNRNLFIIIFGLTTLYFAGSMVRLTILLAPAFAILMGFGIVNLLRPFVTLTKKTPGAPTGKKIGVGRVGKEFGGGILILMFLILTLTYAFPSPRVYTHAYSPPTILASSVPIRPTESINEWIETLNWMQLNLPETAIICSWWDYGYWITVRGNQTSLADNATFNSTHIGWIGKVFMSNETEAVRILKEKFNGPDGPPTHILVFTTFNSFGGDSGYGDEGKWRWMARIANQTVAPGFYHEWGDRQEFNTFGTVTEEGWEWNAVGKNTTIYKLMQTAKLSIAPFEEPPQLKYFSVTHYSPGTPVARIGTYQEQPVYLHALVALYEVDYQQYSLDHPNP